MRSPNKPCRSCFPTARMIRKSATLICLIVALSLNFPACSSQDNAKDYANAVSMMESGDYASAVDIFGKLGDYEDSKAQLESCKKLLAEQEAYNAAVTGYNLAIQDLESRTRLLDELIAEAEALIASGEPALDASLVGILEAATLEAKTARTEAPEMPEETQAICNLTAEIESVDYTDASAKLTEALQNTKTSMAQYALVNVPAEEYILQCLAEVSGITGIGVVTEMNDPNGKLNKEGGYVACVFFSHELINPNPMTESAVLNKATTGGGCIEVYPTAEDAEKRNVYLSGFDGTFLDSGSHCVIGTVLVRTSCKLTPEQQQALESSIIEVLTRIK